MPVVLTQPRKCNTMKKIRHYKAIEPNECIMICLECNTFETVCLVEDMLVPTKKYRQVGACIYQDCGSNKPCRLYHSF
jgi:hypothetical protein